ncbi:hypothetical protein M2323_002309 [Rhodoblastus acidophilus]|nr:hypothetical protein [Rhodoblastus acidophilus]MCW2333375.1 hypothetical protein [Rhodoblastus acidophilus]
MRLAEHGEIKILGVAEEPGFFSIAGQFRHVSGALQGAQEFVAHLLLVFHNQDAHGFQRFVDAPIVASTQR